MPVDLAPEPDDFRKKFSCFIEKHFRIICHLGYLTYAVAKTERIVIKKSQPALGGTPPLLWKIPFSNASATSAWPIETSRRPRILQN
jgi:hypothetical protein